MTKQELKQLVKESLKEMAFSKTVSTAEEAANILKVAYIISKLGSYRNLHKGKGPNGNVTEIFAEFVKNGEQVARIMVNNSYNENEVEVSVEVTSQKWSSRSGKFSDNVEIKKKFKIDDSNLIKFLKNPIQGKSDDEDDAGEAENLQANLDAKSNSMSALYGFPVKYKESMVKEEVVKPESDGSIHLSSGYISRITVNGKQLSPHQFSFNEGSSHLIINL
jgi:hypothetical protein